MTELPTEILEIIMSMISAEELKACSQVCTKWAELVNSNRLWKPHCLQRKWTRVYLTSESVDSGNYCEWRRIYELNSRLYTKWRDQEWSRHTLSSKEQPGDVFSLNSDSKCLAIGYQDGTILAWDISSKPKITASIKCILPDYPVLDVEVSNGKITAVQDRLVQLFDTNSKDTSPQRVLCLDMGSNYTDLTSSWAILPYFNTWYRDCQRVNETKPSRRLMTALSPTHLVVSTGENGALYTLNLDLEESRSFDVDGKITQLTTCSGFTYIATWDRRRTKIYELSDLKSCLDPLIDTSSTCSVVISEKFILTITGEGFSLSKLRVWSRRNGDYIAYQTVSYSSTNACVTQSDLVVFTEENTIIIWDPIEDLLIREISLLPQLGGQSFSYIETKFSDFMVVLVNNSVEVFDWANGELLYSIPLMEMPQDINLIWTSSTSIVVGTVYNHPELLSFV